MKTRTFILKALLIFICSNWAFGQSNLNTYLVKNSGQLVDNIDSADFIRVIETTKNDQGLYNVYEFYKDKSKKTLGNSFTYDFSPRYSGNVISYYKNGKKESVESFVKGMRQGTCYYYYPNGNFKKQIEYNRDEKNQETELMVQIADSTGHFLLDSTATGKFKIREGNEEQEGAYLNGLKNGIFKTHEFKLNEDYVDEYDHGKFIKGKTIDSLGNITTYDKLFALPTFKGGIEGFSSFLSRKLRYPDQARRDRAMGRVFMGFVVEKDGSISDLKVLKGVTKELNDEAFRVLQMSPKWNPGISRGKAVRVYYTIPIFFQLN